MGEGREGLQFFSVRRVRQMVDSSEKGSVMGTQFPNFLACLSIHWDKG